MLQLTASIFCASNRRPALTDKLAILIATADTQHPAWVSTPLVHALTAQALEAEVEIHFAGPAIRWLVEGEADQAWPTEKQEKSIGAFLRELNAAGIPMFACGMAVASFVEPEEKLVGWAKAAGATSFVARVLDPAWRTLSY